jgi:hypothetical protein
VHDAAADDREDRSELLDRFVGHGEVVAVQHDEIGELAGLDRTEQIREPLLDELPGIERSIIESSRTTAVRSAAPGEPTGP